MKTQNYRNNPMELIKEAMGIKGQITAVYKIVFIIPAYAVIKSN